MTALVRSVSTTDLLLLTVVTIWGINYTIVKVAVTEVNPLVFNSLRFTLASLVLLPLLMLSQSNSRLDRRTLAHLLLVGMVGNGIGQLAFISGISRTSASVASLIMASTPIFVTTVNATLGIERVRARGWVGILFSFLGIILMMDPQLHGHTGSSDALVGDLLVLAAALCWALYTAISRPILSSVDTLRFVAYTIAFGTPLLLLVSIPSLIVLDFHEVSWITWASLAFSSVLCIAFAYVVWYSGVRKIGSTRTAIYQNLSPLVAVIFATQVLGEQMLRVQVAGAALLFLGIYLTRFSKR